MGKSPRFRGRALDFRMYMKSSGTLITHKTPSKYAPYEFKLHFNFQVFHLCVQAIFESVFKNPPALEDFL